jgi:AbrB family looped-hinge helix DNA binding protein
MNLAVSTITAKGRTTIPAKIRAKLRLKPGDAIAYLDINGAIVIGKIGVVDPGLLRLQEHALSDWRSPEADEAFRDL